jgi:hypothetical protein
LKAIWEARIDLALFRVHTFVVANFSGGGLYRIGNGGLSFMLALLLQLGLGLSPLVSGLLILSNAAGALTMKFTVNAIIRRFGFRSTLIVNGVVYAACVALCTLFGRTAGMSSASREHGRG